MKKLHLLIIILSFNLGFSQTKSEISLLLNEISETENSIYITNTRQASKIIDYGDKSLAILTDYFTDTTLTKVKSECQKRFLTKGDIAIILADTIKRMHYFQLTGIQNCLATFCENNPNLIEYYLWAIEKNGREKFQKKYRDWIYWEKLSDKERKKITRENKRKYRKQKREAKNQ